MLQENFNIAQKKAQEIKEYARSIIKEGADLLDIATKIDEKILELGCKPAFPVNLCKDEIAAHFTPSEPGEKASGLLKIDLGIIYKEALIDTAFSLDLSKEKEYTKLIQASEKALQEAGKLVKKGVQVNQIGKVIHDTIVNLGFSPIRNLSGHQVSLEQIHAGTTIPNYDNNNSQVLEKGMFAIEPFSTTGEGLVIDGKASGIFNLIERKAIRDSLAREILAFIEEEYTTLPFCERWIINKFGTRAKRSLQLMTDAGILHNYPVLIEKTRQPVAQTENTFLIE